MIKRRQFLVFSSLLGLSPYIEAKEMSTFESSFKSVEPTIAAVQEHLFPEGSQIPSARSMHAIQFLFETVDHKSYDRDIRAFVIEGAQELEKRVKLDKRTEGRFVLLSSADKEKALRAYEETNYGSNWLSRIMTLTMEGLFCDPLYGSNVKEAGWKALNAYGASPRPKTRYIEL